MEDTVLLTDDEIVALSLVDGRPWPIGLLTVDTTADELTQAGMRGMRSLMVRRLAGGDAQAAGFRPHEFIAQDVSDFLGAPRRIGAYLADVADLDVLAGASITAARAADCWILDSTTATGVHALRRTTADQAAAAVLDLADRVHRGEFFTDAADRNRWACVLRPDSTGDDRVTVGYRSATGHAGGVDVTGWDPALVSAAFTE